MPPRILAITHEMLPKHRGPATGGGIRLWGLVEGLRSHGLEVPYAVLGETYRRMLEPEAELKEFVFEDADELASHLKRFQPDAILCEQWLTVRYLPARTCPVLLDLPGPLVLENLYYRRDWMPAAREKIVALSRADLFLFSTDRLRRYYLSWMLLAGVDLKHDCVQVVPTCFPPNCPSAEPGLHSDGPTLLYAGVSHPWQQPAEALREVLGLLEGEGTGKLLVLAGRHPLDFHAREATGAFLKQLPRSSRLEVRELVPFEEFTRICASATAALDVMEPNVERHNSSPVRTGHFLWCGLPVLLSSLSPLAAQVAGEKAGWVLEPGDREGLREAIRAILRDPREARQRGERARALAEREFCWDRATASLAQACEQVSYRVKRGHALIETFARSVAAGHAAQQLRLEKQSLQEAREKDRVAFLEKEGTFIAEVARLRDEVDGLRQAVSSAHAHIEQLREEKQQVVGERDGLAETLEEEANTRRAAQRSVVDLEESLAQLERQVQQLEAGPPRTVKGLAFAARQFAVIALVCLGRLVTAPVRFLVRFFRWRWLHPVRSRRLGFVTLIFLLMATLAIYGYLMVAERIRRRRLFI